MYKVAEERERKRRDGWYVGNVLRVQNRNPKGQGPKTTAVMTKRDRSGFFHDDLGNREAILQKRKRYSIEPPVTFPTKSRHIDYVGQRNFE